MKYVINFFIVTFLLAVGFSIGATKFQGLFTGIKWTDVGIFLVTLLGFCFGFFTYFQWLKGKRKEDAYLIAKDLLRHPS